MDDTARTTEKVHLPGVPGTGGVVWSAPAEGFHTNLVVLSPDGGIDPHRNDAVDVLLVVLDGGGAVLVDRTPVDVGPGDAVVVPRGAERAVRAGEAGVRYLSIHGQREPLGIGRRGGA
jgi:mannose-6-phosphate isomerase-like protein (cupin superfamily)